MPQLAMVVPFAGVLGVNLALVHLIDEITADLPWMPGSGQAAEVVLIVLVALILYALVRDHTARLRSYTRRSRAIALGFVLLALLSLLLYRGLASALIYEFDPLPSGHQHAEGWVAKGAPVTDGGWVTPLPFLRPVYTPGPEVSGDELRPSLRQYLAVNGGDWSRVLEHDRARLDHKLDEYPEARIITRALFVLLYGSLVCFVTLSVAFFWKESPRPENAREGVAGQIEVKPTSLKVDTSSDVPVEVRDAGAISTGETTGGSEP